MQETYQGTLLGIRDVAGTRLPCGANKDNLFVRGIAPTTNNSSANQQRCPEKQRRGRLRNRGGRLLQRSRRGIKGLEWILFRAAATEESCGERKAKYPFPRAHP